MRYDFKNNQNLLNKNEIDFEALKKQIPIFISKFPNETIDVYTDNCVLSFKYDGLYAMFKFVLVKQVDDRPVLEIINFEKYKEIYLGDYFSDIDMHGYYHLMTTSKERLVQLFCECLDTINKLHEYDIFL